jgi:dihydropteroate synthase
MKTLCGFATLLKKNKPLIMGILNTTPDSFSDGGKFTTLDSSSAHALQMINEGADLIDIGGQSTRPGAVEISAEEEIRRILPVIKYLRKKAPEKILSVDTSKAEVAETVLKEGVAVINDVSGGQGKALLEVVSKYDAGLIIMHKKGSPESMQLNPSYEDVVGEIKAYLTHMCDLAYSAGVSKDKLVVDPGIGFGKLLEHNMAILNALTEFSEIGYPVMIGTSRKRSLQEICGTGTPSQLEGATCATTALGVQSGVTIFRVHDVKANRQAADVAWAVLNHQFGK